MGGSLVSGGLDLKPVHRCVEASASVHLIAVAVALSLTVAACNSAPTFPSAAPATGKRTLPVERDFRASDIAKADIDVAAEAHVKECLASARLLMEKLYKRNPREWRKGGYASVDAAVARAFDTRSQFRFPELDNRRGTELVLLALKPDYNGDRVFAFGVGLASMVYIAYGEKTEFYLTDTLDAQKLYNSARNIEIAAWKLGNARDARGTPLLLANEMSNDAVNISFEREFGKMIAYQDVMAEIAAQRTNRIIRRAVQTLATAVFLPI
jgi:hypothetical protein